MSRTTERLTPKHRSMIREALRVAEEDGTNLGMGRLETASLLDDAAELDAAAARREADVTYLASPYSHADPEVRRTRYESACRAAASVLRSGRLVFSPVAHSHPIACVGGIDGAWDFWATLDRAMLSACKTLTVLRLPGWDRSVGVAAEMEIARSSGKPVEFMDWPGEGYRAWDTT